MSRPEPPIDRSGHLTPSRTPWAVHVAGYVLLALLLAWVLVQRYLRPLVLEEGITVAASGPADAQTTASSQPASLLEQQIDPNTATWPELTHLPRIGEQIAKRIVEYRETHRAAGREPGAAASAPVFACPEDLRKVPGIGPKTVEQIRPHLKFPAPPATWPH